MKALCLAVLVAASHTVAARTGESVAPGNRQAYCRGEVSEQYGAKPTYVKTGKLLKGNDGTTSVSGTVDKGTEGIKKFKCRFDAQGKFVDVMTLTQEGE